jgi:hypothetical protein
MEDNRLPKKTSKISSKRKTTTWTTTEETTGRLECWDRDGPLWPKLVMECDDDDDDDDDDEFGSLILGRG